MNPHRQLRSCQRVAANVKEVVVYTNSLHAQHLLPDDRQLLLDFSGRCGICLRDDLRLRLRKRLAIQFAAGRQRQLRHRHKECRHHVNRKAMLQFVP
ncbi:hypothetical protein D3C76_295970 [compost metagenome]